MILSKTVIWLRPSVLLNTFTSKMYDIDGHICWCFFTFNLFKHVTQLHFNWQGHDDVIKWKHFPRYCPFVPGIHRSPVNSPHKGQWRRALMFSLICAWINRWVNNGEAGDFRRYRTHCDVIVMSTMFSTMVCHLISTKPQMLIFSLIAIHGTIFDGNFIIRALQDFIHINAILLSSVKSPPSCLQSIDLMKRPRNMATPGELNIPGSSLFW